MRLATLLFALALASAASAQTGTITGTVTDTGGGPLTGANVSLAGLAVGGAVGLDGTYRFQATPGTYELRASFLGYAPQRLSVVVRAGQTTTQDFMLAEDFVGTDELVVLGGRGEARTVVESAVPIDVISPAEIEATGFTDTQQILAAVIPSFNAPQASITDGSDHVRPATLRGLGPDQVLVLINGKRRHTSALVHVNGSVGRGSTGIDLNAIPPGAIARIEVLRDGAAAQYGSDAIAGVINIVLKSEPGFDAGASYGQYLSTTQRGYDPDEGLLPGEGAGDYSFDDPGEAGYQLTGGPSDETYTDGQTLNAHVGYGTMVGKGTVFVTGQVRRRDETNRAGLDPRQQYYDGFQNDPSFDPQFTEATFDRLNHRYGNGDFTELSLFANAEVPVTDNGVEAYAFGGATTRDGESGCFYRRSQDNRTNRGLYPDGFLPKISAVVNDYALAGGVRGAAGGWAFDLSEAFGTNDFTFNMTDTHNASMNDGQTAFDAGTLAFTQATTNFDLFRAFQVGTASPLGLGIGFEYRYENYEVRAGEPNSYLDGGRLVADGPNAGASTSPGSQCFSGFQPASAQDESRNSGAAYINVEADVLPGWLLSAAARAETYSDFGNTLTAKVATRLELTEAFAVRGAVSTGFRAPSLAQAWFTSIATNFIDGVPFEVGTFPVTSPTAVALGATQLDAEKSLNASAGATFTNARLSLTADVYFIEITDRITFTENFTDPAVRAFLQGRGINASGGRFFTNALDTETVGLDVIGRYGQPVGPGTARLSLGLNVTDTRVTNLNADGVVPAPAQLQALNQPDLVGRVRVGDFEVAQPDSKLLLQLDYDQGPFGAFVRTNRYGEVTSLNADPARDQTFEPRFITDLEAHASVRDGIQLALGATNVFDVYPERQFKANSFNGIFEYNGFSPFGFFGRYVYTRLRVAL
ncbi:TonB-dependent receptor [Rubrivirga sp. IMCC43871]|uniref:TonB-dependent receptor n=1 Tax=Rubrivirga sp. IMCC43871 TaxID=3391575 RepID=UPI0039900A69